MKKEKEMTIPRIMIAAVSSGSGKTLLTCGLLRALKVRKKKVAAFKCGPDYIDPMFHKKILQIPSRNLDTFFTDSFMTRYLFTNAAKDSDVAVIEGVMGYYDGVGGISEQGSSYELAKTLDTPVILVVNAKGMSLSIVPVIKGFLEFRSNTNIKGVILNQVSEMFYKELKKLIENELSIEVLGYVPKVEELVLESRHLGLVMPDEVHKIEEKIDELAKRLEKTLSIDRILEIANSAQEMIQNQYECQTLSPAPLIAIARDEAFCFCYEDNLELMEKMGAKLTFFSPIHDKKLPDNIQGLILYGGYPELYAKQLSKNDSMLCEIRDYVKSKRPILAECGGFMYLHDTMEDNANHSHDMVGAINGNVYKTKRLGRFGYIELKPNKKDTLLELHEVIKGHEFHYFESENCGSDFNAKKPLRNTAWDCIHATSNQNVGFPHLYYYSNPSFIYRFLSRCNKGSV